LALLYRWFSRIQKQRKI